LFDWVSHNQNQNQIRDSNLNPSGRTFSLEFEMTIPRKTGVRIKITIGKRVQCQFSLEV
jgi:hypothetical protein